LNKILLFYWNKYTKLLRKKKLKTEIFLINLLNTGLGSRFSGNIGILIGLYFTKT